MHKNNRKFVGEQRGLNKQQLRFAVKYPVPEIIRMFSVISLE